MDLWGARCDFLLALFDLYPESFRELKQTLARESGRLSASDLEERTEWAAFWHLIDDWERPTKDRKSNIWLLIFLGDSAKVFRKSLRVGAAELVRSTIGIYRRPPSSQSHKLGHQSRRRAEWLVHYLQGNKYRDIASLTHSKTETVRKLVPVHAGFIGIRLPNRRGRPSASGRPHLSK